MKLTHLSKPITNILIKQESNVRSCYKAFFLKPPQKANTEFAKQCIRYSIPDFINEFDKTFIDNTKTLIENLTSNKNFIENLTSNSIESVKNQFKILCLKRYSFECTDESCYPCLSRFTNPFGFSGGLKYLHIFNYMINFPYLRLYLSTGILAFFNIFNYKYES